MLTFIVLAGVLALAAVLLVARPLVRTRAGAAPAAPWAALGACAVLLLGAAILYASLSNWTWGPRAAPDSPQAMVSQLARRLERDPDDLEGWLMLGRSYVALEQYPLAASAYRRADRLAEGRSAEALVGLAEALALQDEAELDGRAGRLLEQALELDPRSPRALFFGAAAALRRGELAVARERFAALLALNPPENVQAVLRAQIAALDREIAAPGAEEPERPPPGAAPAAKGAPAAEPAVRVNVAIAPALRADVPATAPLFVIVRDPSRPGPPLAVKRLASQFPQTVELTAQDAMIAGAGFTAGQQVQVIARIARAGDASARSGDPFGEVRYDVGRDGLVDIVIDRLTP